MRVKIIASTFGLTLQLVLPAFVVGSFCPTTYCPGPVELLSEAVITSNPDQLPREDVCGRYYFRGKWHDCTNVREKVYYQCNTCHVVYRENGEGQITITTGKACTNHHFTQEVMNVQLQPAQTQDFLKNFRGEGSSRRG
ncbi:hypothetical protein PGT21_021296 [Puccinia graminis f. sp. tritici]|uniref:Secreted protein n=1 Tax=Puccinia graminis f. sp. tritici TaxID=56615 RepID=A0A5B0PYJ1_PUCGR|nr:hypothetical protein PGT21_021296 [Puccinia graminis f. sp. tritici]KAA1135088.1 hypothetical protein PGTUg99_005548 [Puccinia graminis f. sp. tritici]